MQCPKCDVDTKTEKYEGVEIDRCPRCKGVWLDDGEIRQVIREREKTFTSEQIRAVVGDTLPVKVDAPEEADVYPCPKCGENLEKHDLTGIMLDRCPNHDGLWFDEGEIEKVQILAERRQTVFTDKERQEILQRGQRGFLATFLGAVAEVLHLK